MSKRLTVMLLILLGAVLLLAHTSNSQVKLFATKVEFSGEVKLVWTKPIGATNTTQFELYRAKLPDTTALLIKTTSDTSFVDHVPPTVSAVPQVFAYKVVAKTGLNSEHSNVVLVPVPGVPLVGAFKLEGKIDSGKIKLYWQKPPVENVSYYLVYRGRVADGTPMHVLIDSTTNQWSISDVPLMPMDSHTSFVFYVKAKLPSGETLISTTLQLTVNFKPSHDELKFVSVPPKHGQINKKYEYTAKAVSSDSNAVIRYYGKATLGMLTVETGFKIDSVTGVVDWTPQLKGWYSIYLYARSNKGGMAKQEFGVGIAGGNGIIQGKVTDTLNVGIPNTIIEVYKTEVSFNHSYTYAIRTDNNGNYRLNKVDPGNYKLRANSPSSKYQSQWYDGKREVSQADIVAVIDSPFVTVANFKLRGGVFNLPQLTVNGTVTDTTGFAISGAECRVVFVRADFAFNLGGGMNATIENFRKYFEFNAHGDFRLEGNSEYVFKAKVDSSGKYSVKLPPGGYIAFARARGYAVEFFNEQSSFLSADIIRLQKDTIGINFTLSPLPAVVLGAINGEVLDSVKDIFVPSRVIAIRDGWRFKDLHHIGRVYVTDTDSTGSYAFDELLPGTYVVMAVPLGNYAPAFYSIDTSNHRWKRATKIEVNGNSVDNINIYVKPFGPSANGYTGISGTVSVSGGNGMMNGSLRAGSVVYAYLNGEVVGYSFTNAEGNYAIGGLSPGQYSVIVDKAGFNESVTATVNASYDNSGNPLNGTANFTINPTTSVTVNTEVQPTRYILEQNYPNPFNPATTIRYSLPDAGTVSLKVYNLVGQEVATLINGYQTVGQYNVTFNGSNLSSGIYFYRLESGSYNVVKKMMLIK